MPRKRPVANRFELRKCPTGIQGIDEITGGGIPRGRPTLITGGPGSGKTLIALEFLVKGITQFDEPGVFMAFEETAEDLATNVSSLGFDLNGLIEEKKLAVDYVYIERAEIEDTGEYDLQGLFVRLGYAIDSIKAKRVVLDTIEVLFGSLPNEGILRAEIRRLLRWLKEKGVTAIVTGERGSVTMTRYGRTVLSFLITGLRTRYPPVVSGWRNIVARTMAPTNILFLSTGTASPCFPSPPWSSPRKRDLNGSPRASPASTPCWMGRAITGPRTS